jgi:ketosteroid isomerase-like protein
MSEENVEIVQRTYEAYQAGDVDRALSNFHPDAAADFSIRGDTGPVTGREALAKTVAAWVNTWDDYSEQIEDIRGVGDRVCVIANQRGRGKRSGVQIDNRFGQVYTVEDGLITSLTMYATPAQALQAAGLLE